jgi:acetyl-CoA acyltransferase 1
MLQTLSLRALRGTLTTSPYKATLSRGMASFLEKKPDDVVFTFAKRTAVGKAKKGQLKDVPVDEMLHGLFNVCLCLY